MHKLVTAPLWPAILNHADRIRHESPADLTSRPGRTESMTGEVAGVHVDWSRQMADAAVIRDLLALAEWRDLRGRISEMFAGEPINTTENRRVLHTALRAPRASTLTVDGVDIVAEVHEVLDAMIGFAEGVRRGDVVGVDGRKFTDIINIGIGGSDLGPAMAVMALCPLIQHGLRLHFASNVDPADIEAILEQCDPRTTLVLVASKTFTTAETMANARAARAWLINALGEASIASHMAAMSTALDATKAFGIDDARVFGFWDWVGGRYSVGSAIGLSLMIAIGADAFRQFLDGMHEVDEHFRIQPLERNIPVILGLLGIWNRNALDIASTAVLPYSQALRRFPAYLQQLTMESNGKSVMLDGQPTGCRTSSVLWGEPGTNGQHSFHQLLHQGTEPIECHVIAFATGETPLDVQHDMLLANALAQAELFATGRSAEALQRAGCPEFLINHKAMPGGRPTTVIVADRLTPRTLGALIALYEHSTFTQGVMWGINSFDQWGVEYGKEVASSLLPLLTGETTIDAEELHPSTAHSLRLLQSLRR